MSEQNGQAADAAGNGGATSSPTDGPQPSADAGGKDRTNEPVVNIREFVELRKETRETARLLKELLERGVAQPVAQPKSAAPVDTGAQALAKLDELEARNIFRECLDGRDLEVTAEQRRDLLELYEAKRGTISDVPGWLDERARAWGLKKRGAATSAAPPPAATPSPAPSVTDTGASARDPAVGLGKGIWDLPPGAARGMTREERLSRLKFEQQRSGVNRNPWTK